MNKTVTDKLILSALQILISTIFLALVAGIIYGCFAIYHDGASWRSNVEGQAYTVKVVNKAKADREAELILQGKLPLDVKCYAGGKEVLK